MTTTPDPPSHDDRAEAAVDELARRSAGAVRRPPPAGAIDSVISAGTRRRRIQAAGAIGGIAVLAAAALALTRAGDDAETVTVDTAPPTVPATAAPTDPPATIAETTTTEAAATTAVPIDEALEWALEFTGGSGGQATGDPVRIGLAGIEPTVSRATVELINTELGGVKGRPVELVECNWVDVPGAVACGQQFAADPSVALVISPVDPVEFLEPLGDTPRFGGFLAGGGSGITYGPSFSSQMLAISDLILRDRPDADKVAFVGLTPSAVLGDRLPGVELVDALSDPTSATAMIEAIRNTGASDADVFVNVLSSAECPALRDALNELGTDATIITDVCTNREEGWYYVDVGLNPDDPSEEWGAAAAVELLDRRGILLSTPEDPLAFGSGAFSDVFNAVKILNDLDGEPTRDEIRRALTEFTGPAALSGPQDCSLQQAPAIVPLGCARFVQVLKVEDGRFVSQEPIEIRP